MQEGVCKEGGGRVEGQSLWFVGEEGESIKYMHGCGVLISKV